MIQAKADVSEPVMMTGFFAILMLFRVFVKRGLPAWGAALAAAVVSPPLTALIEAAWYALVRHIPFWEVLGANIDPDMAFRPSAYVAAAGAAFVIVALLRRAPAPRRSAALSPRPAARRGAETPSASEPLSTSPGWTRRPPQNVMLVRRPTTSSFLICLRRLVRVGDPGSGIDDVLDVGLNLPPGRDLNLIGRLEKGLGAPHGRIDGRVVEPQIAVVAGRAVADPRDPHFDAERIVVASRKRPVREQAGVEAEADEVAILERRERPDG